MQNLLIDWANGAKSSLEEQGLSVRVIDAESTKGVSVDLDGDRFIGTISHWEPNTFEFQFNSATTGDVILLETVELSSTEEIGSHVMALLQTKLR